MMPSRSKQGIRATDQDGSRELSIVHEDTFFPPAEDAERYEKLHPGFMGEVLDMAKKQQDHGIKTSADVIEKSYTLSKRVQIIFLIVAILALLIGGFGFSQDIGFPAALLAVGVISAGITALVIWGK